ncbi:MAG: hypothetical protein WD844_00560 [Thermoleophilaceae bacterium]
MTRARAERIAADPDAAGRLVEQARRHLASAAAPQVDAESAYGLTYQAALKAMIATLLADGCRVAAGAGSHIVTLHEVRRRLDAEAEVLDRIDLVRRTRHAVFYEADEVSSEELRTATGDATHLVEAAARFVAGAKRQ